MHQGAEVPDVEGTGPLPEADDAAVCQLHLHGAASEQSQACVNYYLLFVIYYLLFIYYSLFITYYLLFIIYYLLFVMYYLLFVL